MLRWTSDDTCSISDVEYVCRPMRGRIASTANRMCLIKARWQVEWYEQLLRDLAPRTIIEVGLFDGASLALCAELTDAVKLVGIDNRAAPSAPLATFIDEHDLGERVRPYYGVDQTDTERLAEIVAAEFGSSDLDLVVDDASHRLRETRITFEALFPRVRPGGAYVIEDWPVHRFPSIEQPLAILVLELLLACAEAPDFITRVETNRNYAVVMRGAAPIQPGSFDLAGCYGAGARQLLAAFEPARPAP